MPDACDLDGRPADATEHDAPIQIAKLAASATPIDWVVRDWIASGCVYIFAGSPKVGKTFISMALCAAVSRGQPWLGQPTQARPAIYNALEDGQARIARRAAALGYIGPDWENVPFVAAFGLEAFSRFEQRLLAAQHAMPILVVVDPLAEIASARNFDELAAKDMANFLRPFRRAAQRTGATVVIVHHFRKLGDAMRGSTALQGGCDGWCDFKPALHDSSLFILDWTLRDSPACRIGARIAQPNGVLKIERAALPEGTVPAATADPSERRKAGRQAQAAKQVEAARGWLLECFQDGQGRPQTRGELLAAVQRRALAVGQPARESAIGEALDRLMAEGAVQRTMVDRMTAYLIVL